MLKRGNYAWTVKDEADLTALAGRGVYLRNIALRLRRSESSIKKKANDLGVKVQRTPRFRLDGALRGSPHPSSQALPGTSER